MRVTVPQRNGPLLRGRNQTRPHGCALSYVKPILCVATRDTGPKQGVLASLGETRGPESRGSLDAHLESTSEPTPRATILVPRPRRWSPIVGQRSASDKLGSGPPAPCLRGPVGPRISPDSADRNRAPLSRLAAGWAGAPRGGQKSGHNLSCLAFRTPILPEILSPNTPRLASCSPTTDEA